MKLSEFLSEQSMSQAAFARAIGVTPASINRYLKGNRAPSPIHVRKIKELTGGRVTADDLLCPEAAE